MGNITFKEALLKTAQATKDYIDDKITPITEELNQSNYNIINNGKFQNCYAHTYDMVPSWICDDGLGVWEPRSGGGWRFLNTSSTPGEMKAIRQKINLERDTVYTLSFKAGWQENVNQDIESHITFFNSDGDAVAILTIPVANNDLHFNDIQTFTFTTLVNDFDHCEIKFSFGEHIGSGGMYTMSSVHEVKLEEGDTYTGWRGSRKDEAIIIEGPNLIKNGDFSSFTLPKTIDDWIIGGDGWIWDLTGQDGYNKEGCIYFANIGIDDTYSGFWQDIYNPKKRTEYTLTFYIDWELNVNEFYVDLAFYDINSNRLFGIDLKPSHAGTWSYTFVTPDIDFRNITVGFCHLGIKEITDGAFLGIAGNVKLTERVYIEDLGTVLSNYTTKTEFEQTNEDLAFRIAQSGGGNLIKNSLFKNDTSYWYHLSFGNNMVETSMSAWGAWTEWNNNKYNVLTCFADIDVYGGQIGAGFDTEWIPVQPYTAYSFSCYLACHRSKEVAIEVWYDNGGTNTYLTGEILYSIGTGLSWGQNYDNWTRYETTFTVPSTKRIWLRIYMGNHDENSDQGNAYLWMAQPVLVEGYTPSKVWIPHESELYDGIVKIDDKGIAVQHGDNQSVFDNEALKFYNNGNLYSKIIGGRLEFANTQGNRIGWIGRNYWTNTNSYLTVMNTEYGHTVAIGAPYSADATGYTAPFVVSSMDGYVTDGTTYHHQGINMTSAVMSKQLMFKSNPANPIEIYNGKYMPHLTIWANTESDSRLAGNIYSNDRLCLGTMNGDQYKTGLLIEENESETNKNYLHCYGTLNMHRYNITNAGWTNPVSASSEYTSRLLNEGSNENINYGTLSYYEGEIRWCWKETVFTYAECDIDPETDEWVYTGRNICYVELPIFMAENIQNDYHINVSKMSWGDYRIVEKNPYYFIIESQEEDFAFTFEVIAKLVDSETMANNSVIANDSISGSYSSSNMSTVEPCSDRAEPEIPIDNN